MQFYTPFGEHMRTLRVQGKSLTAVAWELGSLRLALTVDHFIYFASVRPDYRWGFFADTVVYAFNKPERVEHCVVFWNVKTKARVIKFVKNLIGIAAAGEHCVLATKADDNRCVSGHLGLGLALGFALAVRARVGIGVRVSAGVSG